MFEKKEIEIMKLRKKGLTQIEIGKKLKIKQPSVSYFEKQIKQKMRDFNRAKKLIKNLKIKYDEENDEIFY